MTNLINCKWCNKEFKPKHLEIFGIEVSQFYCSDPCRKAAFIEFKRQERIEKYHGMRKDLIQDGLLPDSFWDHVNARAQQQAAFNKAIKSGQCVWIYGQTGRGKSYLARMILQYEIYTGKRAAFETASNLFNGAKRYETLQRVPVLCIDDIDKAAYGAYTASLLHDCLTLRENRKCRTIVTSEVGIKSVAQKIIDSTGGAFGQSTFARLDCRGKRLDIHLEGENLRRAT